jgi:hypothetical protein
MSTEDIEINQLNAKADQLRKEIREIKIQIANIENKGDHHVKE